MEITDLHAEERLGLVALLKLVVRADHTLSRGEAAELRKVAAAMGEQQWQQTIAEAGKRFKSVADAKRAAFEVKRPAARELIYHLVLEAAQTDAITPKEAEILKWLAESWGFAPVGT